MDVSESKATQVTALASVFLVLTSVTMAIRLYVRGFMIKSLGIDDYIMVISFLCYLGYLICQLVGVSYGIGRHRAVLEDARAEVALMCWWLCEVFYAPTTSLLKVSVGFFLLRITVNKYQIWIIRLFVAGSMLCGTIYFLLIIFQCNPISFWWDLDVTHKGKCINALAFAICSWVISILNSAADLTFAIVPMFLVAQTTMSSRTRVLVCILLGIASIAGIVTIIRMPYLHTLDHYKGDFLWNTINVAALTTLECGLGITAANLATFRPLIRRVRGTTKATSTGQDRSQSRVLSLPMNNLEHRNQVASNTGIKKTTTYITSVSDNEHWRQPGHSRSESKEALNYIDDMSVGSASSRV
ncbi:hypothetical protein K461DRAFT_270480 [Myriangium duriaei CBS 260.36]|uniref:Rhodopsin domain-containing protein n=1 Tax=Myriangium duriaei CBS 260.36 TaxID=1168546 RepID=A0A9P4IWS8_9PEZI|nr:hypothetical protein K461DRAFT_270480 [Myriangium duriaei CBS 260.36]